ncbi:DUF3299 domain-containing protein [Azomonas macrocytogenes]|uniref:DUF3299 domain-containing protein n=1 Tax=Azomonas macrocytogenes TaxID=69962 RepID=A0A839T217_AZOMA|nr:DUF3299 domain-containing protein [Azomonas macrocytogenes]MBB3103148.1 hypothetical protein [Azomonas macrocytogenes]
MFRQLNTRLWPILSLLLAMPVWSAEIRDLRWAEMIPPHARLLPPPVPLHDLSQLANVLAAESGPAAVQQAPAAPVVESLDGAWVKLPGYIVPLEFSAENRAVDFLLVPYLGACIHVPPPPSNQIVHVRTELGVLVNDLDQPFWVEGILQVKHSSSELAEAGYAMEADKIYLYGSAER